MEAPMPQNCNQCWRQISGTICRTSCNHLFCEECAHAHFPYHSNCPACNEMLDPERPGTFQELLVGVAPNSLIDTLFQQVYSEPEHHMIGQQVLYALHGCREVMATHLSQLNLEISRQHSIIQQNDLRRVQESKASNELKQRCASLEHKVQELERRNSRLERQLTDVNVEFEKANRTVDSYRQHYSQMKSKSPMGSLSNKLPGHPSNASRGPEGHQMLRPTNFHAGGHGPSNSQVSPLTPHHHRLPPPPMGLTRSSSMNPPVRPSLGSSLRARTPSPSRNSMFSRSSNSSSNSAAGFFRQGAGSF